MQRHNVVISENPSSYDGRACPEKGIYPFFLYRRVEDSAALPSNSLSNAHGQVGRLVPKPPQGNFIFPFPRYAEDSAPYLPEISTF